MGKFINPFTDFGFKHIFGREMDKDILIEFLNDLLEGEHTIMDLRIMNNVHGEIRHDVQPQKLGGGLIGLRRGFVAVDARAALHGGVIAERGRACDGQRGALRVIGAAVFRPALVQIALHSALRLILRGRGRAVA